MDKQLDGNHPSASFADIPPDDEKLELTPEEKAEVDKAAEVDIDHATEPDAALLAEDLVLDNAEVRSKAALESQNADPSVYWPSNDENSPDYRHLHSQTAPAEFSLTPADLELLIAANRFQPRGFNDVICIALRGAILAIPHEVERASSIDLVEVRPNHRDFRCTIGFYYRADQKLTLYSGSTVPAPFYMREYYHHQNGIAHSHPWDHYKDGTNLLPCGCYVARVDRHSSIRPALRMAEPHDLTKDAHATVLRTTNDLVYGTQDIWDPTIPFDNVHCSYVLNQNNKFEAKFSSAGCLTVRGRKDPSHQWKKYQRVLDSLGRGKRCDLMVLTGKETAIATEFRRREIKADAPEVIESLARFRTGSHGDEVTRMQQNLGIQGSGYFGYLTKEKLASYQRDNNIPSDGVYIPELDRALGWNVFMSPSPEGGMTPST